MNRENTGGFCFVDGGEKTTAERKKSLRTYMKRRRGENENRDIKEIAMTERFFSEGFGNKESYFVYLSFSSEASADKLIARLLEAGKKVYAPRLENGGMSLVNVNRDTDYTLSAYGIREPVGERYAGKIDVAIIPLLAADMKGNRLGYGGGYYDRFLAAHPETFAVGWCFDFQIVREVPTEQNDLPMSAIFTDKRTIWTDFSKKQMKR